MLSFLKILLIILANITAILGEFFEYKSNGKLTRIGVIALMLFIFLIMSAIIVEIIDQRNNTSDVKNENLRFESTQAKLNKNIKEVKIIYDSLQTFSKYSMEWFNEENIKLQNSIENIDLLNHKTNTTLQELSSVKQEIEESNFGIFPIKFSFSIRITLDSTSISKLTLVRKDSSESYKH